MQMIQSVFPRERERWGCGCRIIKGTNRSRTWNLPWGGLVVSVADLRYWQETEDTEYEGVESSCWMRCQRVWGALKGESLLTGDDRPNETKSSPRA